MGLFTKIKHGVSHLGHKVKKVGGGLGSKVKHAVHRAKKVARVAKEVGGIVNDLTGGTVGKLAEGALATVAPEAVLAFEGGKRIVSALEKAKKTKKKVKRLKNYL